MNLEERTLDVHSTSVVVPVSALNQAVAQLLEKSFALTWVSGEVSNFMRANSGHCYFTLKDQEAQVRAVLFKHRALYTGFLPQDGDRVEVRALVTMYVPRGEYQLTVETIRPAGVGHLYQAFLQLKNKLAAEGLLDAALKKKCPPFVRTIGLITSPDGAALHDMLTTFARRAAHVQLILYPTPVQGFGAAEKIAERILEADRRCECQLLIVARGGGSMEDLWSFNEEIVARAIVACSLPVISAVGHETDFTIADFVADLRAPTPTAAAEIACQLRQDWLNCLMAHRQQLARGWRRRFETAAQRVDRLSQRLINPADRIREQRLFLQWLASRLKHAQSTAYAQALQRFLQLKTSLEKQAPHTTPRRQALIESQRRLMQSHQQYLLARQQLLKYVGAQLTLLNPAHPLKRGYAILTDARQKIIRHPRQLNPGAALRVQLAQGGAEIRLASVQTDMVTELQGDEK